MLKQYKPNRSEKRRGAVAVEFAFVAPVLVTIVLGMIQVNRIYDGQNLLETAAREGARFAAMDRDGMLADGQTTNSKLANDVKNYLAASGLDRDAVQVNVLDAESPEETFDLDDPANDLRLFVVEVKVPHSSVSFTPVAESDDFAMVGSITFRNGRAVLSE
jgi:Flp pilus assembly protein TadG